MSGFYRGVSQDQDQKYTSAEKKLLQSTKFPVEFSKEVDTEKVNLDVIKPWIVREIETLLGFEDDIVIDYAVGMLEDSNKPDPRTMQLNLTGFLEDKTAPFMLELWQLLLSAQDNSSGIPTKFIEEKRQELKSKREAQNTNDTLSNDDRQRERLEELRRREPSNQNDDDRRRSDHSRHVNRPRRIRDAYDDDKRTRSPPKR